MSIVKVEHVSRNVKINVHYTLKNSVWFLCLMAYQTLWIIQSQSQTCRITVVLFNPLMDDGVILGY